jgi:hypothetical protein
MQIKRDSQKVEALIGRGLNIDSILKLMVTLIGQMILSGKHKKTNNNIMGIFDYFKSNKKDKLERMAELREQMDLIDSILGELQNISDKPKANSNTKKSNEFNIEEGDLEIYLMYEGSLFTYFNENEDEMTFEAFGLIVECPGNEDYEGEVKDALGKLVFTDKGDSLETYLITDLPEDIVDYEFTNSVGNLHDEALNSMEEAVDFIKNLKTISFKEINPKDGECIRYID